MNTLSKQEKVAVGAALIAAAILFFGGQIWSFIFGPATMPNQENQPTQGVQQTNMPNISTVKGLEIYDEVVGTGATAKTGSSVTAHYVGTLTNGKKFDSSVDRDTPFTFTLGAGKVIKGWDIGVVGMKVGGIRRLVISPELGYGDQANSAIPANSTLIFEIQLVAVK